MKRLVSIFLLLAVCFAAQAFIFSGGGGNSQYAADAAHAQNVDNANGTNLLVTTSPNSVLRGVSVTLDPTVNPAGNNTIEFLGNCAIFSLLDPVLGTNLVLGPSGNTLSIGGSSSAFSGPVTATSFGGDGHLLTGITASQVRGVVTNAQNSVSVLDYGAVGDGVTDDTIPFQYAINSLMPVFVPSKGHTNGYVVSNLIFSNGCTLYGNGASHIIMKPGATGWIIQMGLPSYLTNGIYPTNPLPCGVQIYGLDVDGGSNSAIPTLQGTRSGIWFEPFGTNNVVHDCYIHGFTGYGFLSQCYDISLAASFGPQFNPYDLSHSIAYNLDLRGNYIGIAIRSGPIPAPYNDGDTYLSEYGTYSMIRADYNYIGMWKSAGNQFIVNSVFARDSISLVDINEGSNPGHGVFSGCSFNHATTAAIYATNLIYGEKFVGCTFNGGVSAYLTNCTGVQFSDCDIVGGAFNVTFDGKNATSRNYFVWPDITDGSSSASLNINNVGTGNKGLMVGRIYGSATTDTDPQMTFLKPAHYINILTTNIVSTNQLLSGITFGVGISNNGCFKVQFYATAQGFGMLDNPDIYVVSTNTVSGGYVYHAMNLAGGSSWNHNGPFLYNSAAATQTLYPLTATGDGFNRLFLAQNFASQNVLWGEMLCQVTNAPTWVWIYASDSGSLTHTNTMYVGASIEATQIPYP